jgi:hypothetical protein
MADITDAQQESIEVLRAEHGIEEWLSIEDWLPRDGLVRMRWDDLDVQRTIYLRPDGSRLEWVAL